MELPVRAGDFDCKHAVIPAANMPKKAEPGIKLFPVRRLSEVLDIIFQ